MRAVAARLAWAVALLILAAAARARAPNAGEHVPVTILVSIDGFRADYLDRGVTPRLAALARSGVRAAMRPSFPTKTFPNHYAIVTGLRPDRNGIVGNMMQDPALPGEAFTMKTLDSVWWEEAEPIWVAAERAGIRTAPLFWPGSGAVIRGVRPHDWWPFGGAVANRQRTDAIVDWLRRPAPTRPRFLTLYYDLVDTAGHRYGPDSPELNAALASADVEIGRLVDGLAALHRPANIIVLSDHGMLATSADRVVKLETIVPAADIILVEQGVYAAFNPVAGREAAVMRAITQPHEHVHCWPKGQLPPRFHYGRNLRVPAFFCLADPGWLVTNKPGPDETLGNHGYDNQDPRMLALFAAAGPTLARGRTLPTFDNVDVYPLLRRLLGLPPASGIDGGDLLIREALRPAIADPPSRRNGLRRGDRPRSSAPTRPSP